MPFARVSRTMIAAGTVIGIGIASAAFSFAGPADDAIKARQACMKSHGAEMAVMVPIIKGEKPYDKAAIDTVMAAEAKACADWAKFWGADTQKGETAETWAKAEIWSDPAGFEAAGGAWYKANEALKATADEAAFKAAFPALGEACKGCHEKFRRPKE